MSRNIITETEHQITDNTISMTRRKRVMQVLDTSRPNEYVPAAFFMHFKNKLGPEAVQDHRDYFRTTNMDFVKVSYEITLPQIDIETGDDWKKVPVYGEDFFEPQLYVIEELAREFRDEALIMPTVFSPVALARQTLGNKRGDIRKLSELNPTAFGNAIRNLSLSIENYVRAARRHGADGFFVSSQGGEGYLLSEKIWNEQVRHWDKHVAEVAKDISDITILHVCDYFAHYKNAEALYAFTDYPCDIVNVPLFFSDGSTLILKEVEERFGKPVFGGLDRLGAIATGTVEEAKKAVDEVLESAPRNFILGADCTVPADTDWDKIREVIEYAHDWRLTHKG